MDKKIEYFTCHNGLTLERIRWDDSLPNGRVGEVFRVVDGKPTWKKSDTAEDIYFWDYLDWAPCSEEEAKAFMDAKLNNK